jgi:uncharacterized protein (DUF342 family)
MNNNTEDGLVWIKDKVIYVKNEKNDGFPPLIDPCDNIKLIINGKECNRLTSVSESDEIKTITQEKLIDAKLDLLVSDDNMRAILEYTPQKKVNYTLKDASPENKLDIEVEENIIEMINISKNNILELLSKYNIVFGIDYNIIDEIIKTNKEGKYVVARGNELIETVDEKIEFLFENDEVKKMELKEDNKGNIDHKNIFTYINVKTGEIIAKIIPSKKGVHGKTLFGEIIECNEPKLLNIVDSTDTLYDKNKKIIIAKKSGRPVKVVNQNMVMFNIVEKITFNDINMETGNIKFNGDIEINGFVNDSMEVLSKKNIFIKKGCSFANIQAGNSVEIKESIISSNIYAAKNISFGHDPAKEIYKVVEALNNLILNIENFPSNIQLNDNSFHNKIHYLLNNTNKSLPNTIYEVLKKLKKGNFDISKDSLLTFIKNTRVLLGNYLEIENIEYLKTLTESLNIMCLVFDNSTIKGDVKIGYALNSNIYALGNVYITGKGASNTKIFADGNVNISGNFRGGEINSKQNVTINKCGVSSGVKTIISIPFDKIIKFNKVYNETIIKIGSFSYKFLSDEINIIAKIINNKISIK